MKAIDPLMDIPARINEIMDEISSSIHVDRYTELMKEYRVLSQTLIAIQSGIGGSNGSNFPPSGTPMQYIPSLPIDMQRIADAQRRYTFLDKDEAAGTITIQDQHTGRWFSHPWIVNVETASEAYHGFISAIVRAQSQAAAPPAKQSNRWTERCATQACEPVNVGFTSIKMVCKHCDRNC